MKIGFIFPGQGIQSIGMGRQLYKESYVAKSIFDTVDSTLNYNLSDIMFHGPMHELTQSYNTQPAIMTLSIAVLELFLDMIGNIDFVEKNVQFVAGNSVGEFSALYATKCLNLQKITKLLYARGKLITDNINNNLGGMILIIGKNIIDIVTETLHNISNSTYPCTISNYLSNNHLIVSGENKSLELITKQLYNSNKINIIKRLNLHIPFHSPILKNLEKDFKNLILSKSLNQPNTNIIFNTNAKVLSTIQQIKESIIKQIYCPVLWMKSIQYMIDNGVTHIFEFGSSMLSNIINSSNSNVKAFGIKNTSDINNACKILINLSYL